MTPIPQTNASKMNFNSPGQNATIVNGNAAAAKTDPRETYLVAIAAIKKIAKEGPCVIVGRCADYALEDMDNVISIFIHADLDKRVKKIMKVGDLSAAKAKDMIIKNDKKRASYYNYYTNKDWGAAKSYDLCLDSGKLGIEGTVKAILEYVKLRESISDTEL